MNDNLKDVGKVAELGTRVLDLAADTPELRDTGRSFARSTLTIARAVENCLLPIAAVNFAFDKGREYFQQQFKSDLEEITREISPEDVVAPKPSVAAPTLSGLAFAHEEPDLKEMYLHLLRTAMDRNTSASAHPAFAEIIRQLSSEEARLLNTIMRFNDKLPIVTLLKKGSVGIGTVLRNIVNCTNTETGEPVANPDLPSMIDNWLRLGLISVTYERRLIYSDSYDWVKERPEYLQLEETAKRGVKINQGILELSDFGQGFAKAVGALVR